MSAGETTVERPLARAQERTAVIIEDDPDIRELLSTVLTQAGFRTRTAASGHEGVELVRKHDPLVTTLDVSLPDIDGFEACRRIRAVSDTYVVMLTARTEEIDALMGLDAGADDYQTKPFRPRELRARIEAMLRRPRRAAVTGAEAIDILADDEPDRTERQDGPTRRPADDHERRTIDGLTVDLDARTVEVDGADVHLTRSEFDLLAALVNAPGRVLGKDTLVRALWGQQYDVGTTVVDTDRRGVEVHLANLRRKIGDDAARPRWIRTVRGVGYRFDA
ncbi:response regulator transcription factor [Isoptericola croceus]|uniref:response regulator transcription factor n=1 Tax=Isoptericola croceus TaxID=3031406 RepID=UPI0023F89409|nr:response regulator transcription factor [Isoptericola croceus]